MNSWWKRLREELDRKGWTVVEFERLTKIDKGRLYKYVTGEVAQPRGDVFARMAEALGVNEWWLRTGIGARSPQLKIIGQLNNGEQWTPNEDKHDSARYLDFVLGDNNHFALEVSGTSMAPAYRDGDMVICLRQNVGDANTLEPSPNRLRDCAVMTTAGVGYLKYVLPGRQSGNFTLRSYNPEYPDLENVSLAWIAPVVWIRRRG